MECHAIQITLLGGALLSQGSKQGVYVKSGTANGKLSWNQTTATSAIWWSSNDYWIIGDQADIGGPLGLLYNPVSQTLPGPPYGNGNDWFYHNDSAWVNPIDEIIIECSLTTLGKLRPCCI
jgi:hypothetical protein